MSSVHTRLQGSDDFDQDRPPEVIILNEERRIPLLTVVLPNLIVVMFSAGLAIFIIFWLNLHQPQGLQGYESGLLHTIRNGTFIVDESYAVSGRAQEAPLRGLTFSSLATHTISLTSSFLMAMVAYCTAALWLADSRWASEHAKPTQDYNVTPVQYGLLLGIFGAPSIISVFNGIRYAFRGQSRRSKLPSMFIEPLVIASILLFLNYAIGISDLWLHSTTRSTAATLSLPNVATNLADVNFGATFNDTLCPDSITPECLANTNGWAAGKGADWILPNSWLVLYNVSTAPFRIVTLAELNNTAIMVSTIPKALGPLVTSSYFYKSSTIAVQSSCKVITGNCTQDQGGHVTDCSAAGAPYLPLKWNFTGQSPPKCDFSICFPNRIFGVIDGQIGTFMNTTFQVFDPNITAPSGPMTLGMQLQLNQDKVVYHNPSEGVAHDVDGLDALYATCQIEYLTGELSYDPGSDRYTLSQDSSVSPQLASALWAPLLSQYGTNRLIADILGPIMADPSVDPSNLISANLARIALGLLGGIVQPEASTSAITARQGVLGLYPVAPVFCVAGILYVYAFFALFILFALVSSTSYTVTATPTDWDAKEVDPSPIKKERALAIGQLWLTNPLPLIGSIFAGGDGRDPQRSIADKSLNMVFDQEGNVDYLAIGRTKIGKEIKFGLRSRKERTADDSAETL